MVFWSVMAIFRLFLFCHYTFAKLINAEEERRERAITLCIYDSLLLDRIWMELIKREGEEWNGGGGEGYSQWINMPDLGLFVTTINNAFVHLAVPLFSFKLLLPRQLVIFSIYIFKITLFSLKTLACIWNYTTALYELKSHQLLKHTTSFLQPYLVHNSISLELSIFFPITVTITHKLWIKRKSELEPQKMISKTGGNC